MRTTKIIRKITKYLDFAENIFSLRFPLLLEKKIKGYFQLKEFSYIHIKDKEVVCLLLSRKWLDRSFHNFQKSYYFQMRVDCDRGTRMTLDSRG